MDVLPAESATPERSFGALLRDVYIAPSDAFTELARRPLVAPALAGFVAVQIAFVATWLSRMDLVEFLRAQTEASGRAAPPAATMSPAALTAIKWTIAVSGVSFSLVLLLAIAGLLLFVFNFLLGATTSYRQCLAVVAWTAFATGIVTAGLMLAVMALRGEWSLPPDQVLQAGAAAFLDRATVGKFAYSLAQSFDVFSAWMLALASIGMARAARRPTSTAAATVVALWVIFVLGKAALATLA
jgi:hypothetical protein